MGLLSRKKDKEAEEESSRSALFGSRKKDKTPAANPYAAASSDSYGSAPPPYSGGGRQDQYRQEKTPAVGGGRDNYGGGQGQQGGGYSGGGSYQNAGGYGSDRYGGGGGGGGGQAAAPRRPGGYGGLGAADDSDRGALFGNAPQRVNERQQQPGGYGGQAPGGASGAYGQQSGAYGGGASDYSAYQDRELTAEEQEEEDVMATKSEIKFIKQQDVSSTRNALRLAEQAEETGRGTLHRLGAQGERIHNTERNLDLASSQNRIAAEKARELKTLNKSMFAVHVGNPFTSGARREERDRRMLETHQQERAQRDATRKAAWETSARTQGATKGTQSMGGGLPKATLADRAKYQFEADSEDDEMENEIDNNLDQLHGAAKRLNALGRAMGEEVETQNRHINRIIEKTDKVDDELALNRAKLDRIH